MRSFKAGDRLTQNNNSRDSTPSGSLPEHLTCTSTHLIPLGDDALVIPHLPDEAMEESEVTPMIPEPGGLGIHTLPGPHPAGTAGLSCGL